MKTYLSIMLIYWLIADGDTTFMNFHRTTPGHNGVPAPHDDVSHHSAGD